jgi:hypothetical protein
MIKAMFHSTGSNDAESEDAIVSFQALIVWRLASEALGRAWFAKKAMAFSPRSYGSCAAAGSFVPGGWPAIGRVRASDGFFSAHAH